MQISEIFYSLQGEGILTGVPSLFVRTTGCNLRCVWCDTPYTSWRPEGENVTLSAILDCAAKYKATYVVVTGGEPMIAPEIVELTKALRGKGYHITIETAGTVLRPVECDLMSISPKLSNSIPHSAEGGRWAPQHERLRYQPEVLRELISTYSYQLKFVISSPDDITEVRDIVGHIGAEAANVLLMPEGTNIDLLAERSRWLAEVCKELNYRFCQRLHVMIWGDRRGV